MYVLIALNPNQLFSYRNSSLYPGADMALESRPFNSWDALKILALALMFVDHAGAFVFTGNESQYWLRAIGRGAAPIFLFLAGYASSYRFNREILILALLLAASDLLLTGTLRPQNILFSILICRQIFNWFEKRGQIIQKPYDWVVGGIILFPSMILVHYGTLGFLFALCGYMQRHKAHYAPALIKHVQIITFFFYGLLEYLIFTPPISLMLTILTLSGVCLLLARMQLREVRAPWCPAWVLSSAKAISHYTGYIYVFHLIALEWITGIPL